MKIGPDGIALIKSFEGCAKKRADGTFEAYPNPGVGAIRGLSVGDRPGLTSSAGRSGRRRNAMNALPSMSRSLPMG